ncbi:MAG: FAD binding domain-containing protein, partial [Dehalococcoidia bacterium]|nr:FAD binding domain-containing protein [Dehalococcoidia bacterium]
MGPFEYFEPVTVEEALSLLEKYGEKAKVLAGGTDLVVVMREREIRPQYVINIGRIAGLSYINLDGGSGPKIGALTTISEIEHSPVLGSRYRIISQAASKLANIAIRNMATIGGNLCNAAPSADMAPPLLALKAAVKLAGTAGERVVPLEGFFISPGLTTLKG